MTAVVGQAANTQQVLTFRQPGDNGTGEDGDSTGTSDCGGAVNHRSGYRQNL